MSHEAAVFSDTPLTAVSCLAMSAIPASVPASAVPICPVTRLGGRPELLDEAVADLLGDPGQPRHFIAEAVERLLHVGNALRTDLDYPLADLLAGHDLPPCLPAAAVPTMGAMNTRTKTGVTAAAIVLLLFSAVAALLALTLPRRNSPAAPPLAGTAPPVEKKADGFPYPECAAALAWIRNRVVEPDTIKDVQWIARDDSRPPVVQLKVQFRTKNDHGGWSVSKMIISLEGGRVTPASGNADWW